MDPSWTPNQLHPPHRCSRSSLNPTPPPAAHHFPVRPQLIIPPNPLPKTFSIAIAAAVVTIAMLWAKCKPDESKTTATLAVTPFGVSVAGLAVDRERSVCTVEPDYEPPPPATIQRHQPTLRLTRTISRTERRRRQVPSSLPSPAERRPSAVWEFAGSGGGNRCGRAGVRTARSRSSAGTVRKKEERVVRSGGAVSKRLGIRVLWKR